MTSAPALFSLPATRNELPLDYAPGSPERAAVDAELARIQASPRELPLRIGIALGIHDAVLRRHEALVRPAAADEHLTTTIPDDIAAITAAIAAGDAEVARTRMRTHVEAWNRRTNG